MEAKRRRKRACSRRLQGAGWRVVPRTCQVEKRAAGRVSTLSGRLRARRRSRSAERKPTTVGAHESGRAQSGLETRFHRGSAAASLESDRRLPLPTPCRSTGSHSSSRPISLLKQPQQLMDSPSRRSVARSQRRSHNASPYSRSKSVAGSLSRSGELPLHAAVQVSTTSPSSSNESLKRHIISNPALLPAARIGHRSDVVDPLALQPDLVALPVGGACRCRTRALGGRLLGERGGRRLQRGGRARSAAGSSGGPQVWPARGRSRRRQRRRGRPGQGASQAGGGREARQTRARLRLGLHPFARPPPLATASDASRLPPSLCPSSQKPRDRLPATSGRLRIRSRPSHLASSPRRRTPTLFSRWNPRLADRYRATSATAVTAWRAHPRCLRSTASGAATGLGGSSERPRSTPPAVVASRRRLARSIWTSGWHPTCRRLSASSRLALRLARPSLSAGRSSTRAAPPLRRRDRQRTPARSTAALPAPTPTSLSSPPRASQLAIQLRVPPPRRHQRHSRRPRPVRTRSPPARGPAHLRAEARPSVARPPAGGRSTSARALAVPLRSASGRRRWRSNSFVARRKKPPRRAALEMPRAVRRASDAGSTAVGRAPTRAELRRLSSSASWAASLAPVPGRLVARAGSRRALPSLPTSPPRARPATSLPPPLPSSRLRLLLRPHRWCPSPLSSGPTQPYRRASSSRTRASLRPRRSARARALAAIRQRARPRRLTHLPA
jgi:hypothetical protein